MLKRKAEPVPIPIHRRYIFCVDNNDSAAGRINSYYTNNDYHPATPFIPLKSIIPITDPPSLEQQIANLFITSILTSQKNKNSFCSKNENGVNPNYIIQEFISDPDKITGIYNILINTVIYLDHNNEPFAFLMYNNYLPVANSVYISILCINSLTPKEHYPQIYGDLIVNNFKVACETVGVDNIYLESIPSAEEFWSNKGFNLVDPQPVIDIISSSDDSSDDSSDEPDKLYIFIVSNKQKRIKYNSENIITKGGNTRKIKKNKTKIRVKNKRKCKVKKTKGKMKNKR